MVRYRLIWGCGCGLLVALGVAAALFTLPTNGLVSLFVVPAFIGLSVVLSVAQSEGQARGRWRRAVRIAVLTGFACVGGGGLVALLGPSILLLGLLLAGISPAVVRRLRGRRADKRDELTDRSTTMLCRQWQASYQELRTTSAPMQRLRIVEERARYLDELERRDPVGLQAWLSSSDI